jgi:preprotein translocase subunit SecG
MILSYISMTVLMITGILMIIVILLQRGRGGGLAGAFGGLGGQSAFGTKAGDVFTKITVVLAVFWVALAGLSGLALERDANRRYTPAPGPESIESKEGAGIDITPGKSGGEDAGSTTSDADKGPDFGTSTDKGEKPTEKSATPESGATQSEPPAGETKAAPQAGSDAGKAGDGAEKGTVKDAKATDAAPVGQPGDQPAKK